MPRSAVALARIATASVPAETTDAQLLRAFVSSNGNDCFAELVRRHGPMVLAACRRVLSDTHDAEDAFQATFLVLARKASSVRGTNVAGYLYAVAVRTARSVRVMRERRRKHEQAASASGGRQPPVLPATDCDTAAVIDEELANLPEHYRDAVVLCELRGLSRRAAAIELGIAEGTLSSRLATAKRKLAERLSARGLAGIALATALGPATVSAGLLEATAVAVRGAAGGVASAAASTVLKGMLFDQLRATVLAGAVLIAGACGGLALTGTPAPSEKAGAPARTVAPAPRLVIDPAAKLVERLGSENFADRESAQKELRKLGLKAEPALKAGRRSDDPEVRARCAALIAEARASARDALVKTFDPAGEVEPNHPIWERFKSIAGRDKPARKLFAELISDPRRLKLLDDADRDPEKAGDLYAAELDRLFTLAQKAQQANRGVPKPGAVADADAVVGMYLGTFPPSTGKAKEGWKWEGHLFTDTWDELVASPVGPPVRRIFAAWLPVRDSADARERGLAIATNHRIREAAPFARGALADEKEPPLNRAQAALLLGVVGGADDLPQLRRAAGSELANKPFDRFNVILKGQQELDALWGRIRFGEKVNPEESKRIWKEADIRTCDRTIADCAWAAAVRLGGGKPEELGFCWSRTVLNREVNDHWFGIALIHGFPDDKSRAAAHARAKAFLDKPKDAPKEPK